MAKPSIVIVKLRRFRAQFEQQRSIRDLVGKELVGAEPVFGDSDEPELATLFEVRVRRGADVQRVIDRLLKDDEVEYAHVPAERRPK